MLVSNWQTRKKILEFLTEKIVKLEYEIYLMNENFQNLGT